MNNLARQTYIVSDLTGEPITDGQRVILTLKFEGPTRPWLTLDASESDKAITSLNSSAREIPRRAAESGV